MWRPCYCNSISIEFFSAIEAGCNRSWIDTVMSSFLFQLLMHPASIALKYYCLTMLLRWLLYSCVTTRLPGSATKGSQTKGSQQKVHRHGVKINDLGGLVKTFLLIWWWKWCVFTWNISCINGTKSFIYRYFHTTIQILVMQNSFINRAPI